VGVQLVSKVEREDRPLTSPAFKARTTWTRDEPQVCGLHHLTGCTHDVEGYGPIGGALIKDQKVAYLTCKGTVGLPEHQVFKSKRDTDYETGFRVVPTGNGSCRRGHSFGMDECEQDDRKRKRCPRCYCMAKPDFQWQERDAEGRWHYVETWERMVHVACAHQAGFRVLGQTNAHVGSRTKGYAHTEGRAEGGLEALAHLAAELEAEGEL